MKLTLPFTVGIFVLAGGLGARMGHDKARLRLGRRTLLGHVLATARQLGLPVRAIRRDAVPRCGPLGGVITALRSSPADRQLFLACDMPLVSAQWMEKLLAPFAAHERPVFTASQGRAGFPFVLPRGSLMLVEKQIAKREFSLQALARVLDAKLIHAPASRAREFLNVNTPVEWKKAREQWKAQRRVA